MVSPNSLSLERMRSLGSEDVPQPNIGGEVATEVTLSEAILEQIVAEVDGTVGNQVEEPRPPPPEKEVTLEVSMKTSSEEVKTLEITFPDFLQDSVVPLLKYLDTKREKYSVRKESLSYVELIRNRTKLKRAVVVKRELQYCQPKLEETCGGLCVSTENAQKLTVDLLGRLEKSKESYAVLVKRSERMITTIEMRKKMHAEMLANAEARIAEEVCIVKNFRERLQRRRRRKRIFVVRLRRLQIANRPSLWRSNVKLGAEISSDDTVTAKLNGTAAETDSPQAVEIPELPL
ncbi:hypothetical protein AXG93_392s1620 [Marchantia polymorpha subsp. ruderalis]|uniref:Uncharacterized protein n=1 Tax=Marchantia polymorpha subsp. ruderalis TaxID=1480154 RepID=A0A176WRZ0_MARPO|nr:hypothetical protein AXG93_392s1620 [Marchantia polymorpha subsp. ruderalis]